VPRHLRTYLLTGALTGTFGTCRGPAGRVAGAGTRRGAGVTFRAGPGVGFVFAIGRPSVSPIGHFPRHPGGHEVRPGPGRDVGHVAPPDGPAQVAQELDAHHTRGAVGLCSASTVVLAPVFPVSNTPKTALFVLVATTLLFVSSQYTSDHGARLVSMTTS
jgi:hypothetical protein